MTRGDWNMRPFDIALNTPPSEQRCLSFGGTFFEQIWFPPIGHYLVSENIMLNKRSCGALTNCQCTPMYFLKTKQTQANFFVNSENIHKSIKSEPNSQFFGPKWTQSHRHNSCQLSFPRNCRSIPHRAKESLTAK